MTTIKSQEQIIQKTKNNIIACESFSQSEELDQNQPLLIAGVALPFGQVSRNGFYYIPESVQEASSTMVGLPLLYNHNEDIVIGKITSESVTDSSMNYVAELDQTENAYVHKIRNKYLSKVSINCIYDPDKSYVDESGVVHAWVKEFIEMSVVSTPGFIDTNITLLEKLKHNGHTITESVPNKESCDDKEREEMADDNKPKTPDMEEVMKKISEMDGVIKAMQKKIEEMQMPDEEDKKEEEYDETEDPEDKKSDTKENVEEKPSESETEKEEKVAEAMKTDRIAVPQVSEKVDIEPLTLSDLKEAFKKII